MTVTNRTTKAEPRSNIAPITPHRNVVPLRRDRRQLSPLPRAPPNVGSRNSFQVVFSDSCGCSQCRAVSRSHQLTWLQADPVSRHYRTIFVNNIELAPYPSRQSIYCWGCDNRERPGFKGYGLFAFENKIAVCTSTDRRIRPVLLDRTVDKCRCLDLFPQAPS